MRCLLPLLLLATALFAEPEYPKSGPDIYDPQADGVELIAKAVTEAQSAKKHVLLDFGANWCPWCHKLHTLFTTNKAVAAALERDYVVVMIDVNMRKGVKRNANVNERYGNPINEGLPVLVVLDSEGIPLVTQETGALENGPDHDPAKVLAFLAKWAPKR